MAGRPHSQLDSFRLALEGIVLREKLRILDVICEQKKIKHSVLSQVEECRALQYQCEFREAAIIQHEVSSPCWFRNHVLKGDRVLRTYDLANSLGWNGFSPSPYPSRWSFHRHIYQFDPPDFTIGKVLLHSAESNSDHQNNHFGILESFNETANDLPQSESGYDPQPDLNLDTRPNLEGPSVRNSGIVVNGSDARGSGHRLLVHHDYITGIGSTEPHRGEQFESGVTQHEIDTMVSLSTNKRVSDEILPLIEDEPIPLSPLAVLSSVATSWINSSHSEGFHETIDIDWSALELPSAIPNSVHEQLTEHVPVDAVRLSEGTVRRTLQNGQSRSSSSESKRDTPSPALLGDEDMADTPDHNNQHIPCIPEVETVPKLRKHFAKFACSLPGCKKRFTRRVNLNAHIRTHLENTQAHVCAECGKTFARVEDRRRHVKERHQGISKRHVCGPSGTSGIKGCGQSFTRAEALRRHRLSKAGSNCGRAANQKVDEGPQTRY